MSGRAASLRRLAAAAALVLGGAFLVGATDPLGSPSESGSSLGAQLAGCALSAGDRRDACFRRSLARAAAAGRVTEALAALESSVDRGLLDDCHLEAHALAHAVVGALGAEGAFLLGTDQCRMGYVHGVVEASAGRRAVAAAGVRGPAASRCSRFRPRALRGACSHGLGHALMRASGNDVRRSLRGCRRAAAIRILVPSCEAGVMMQSSLRYADLPPERFRRAASAACAALAASDQRRSCYDNLGGVAALSFRHDSRRSASLCRRLPDRIARAACLGGARDEIEEARRESGR